MKNIFPIAVSLALLLGGCSKTEQPIVYEYYAPSYRKLPPEPVYGRLSWSHLPQPIRPKAKDTAPLLNPLISFEMPNSNFGEAVEALAQTIGYRWKYPERTAKHRISLNMEGTAEEILRELSSQSGVRAVLDHRKRIIRVIDKGMIPTLPNS